MRAALVGAGVTRDAGVAYADELRLGLRGQVRRVLAPRGVKVVQRLQLRYQWAYLLLAVDPRAGTLRWRWPERCRAGPIREALAAWAPGAVVWDGRGAHTARLLLVFTRSGGGTSNDGYADSLSLSVTTGGA